MGCVLSQGERDGVAWEAALGFRRGQISCVGDTNFGELNLKQCGCPETFPRKQVQRPHESQTKPLFPPWCPVLPPPPPQAQRSPALLPSSPLPLTLAASGVWEGCSLAGAEQWFSQWVPESHPQLLFTCAFPGRVLRN